MYKNVQLRDVDRRAVMEGAFNVQRSRDGLGGRSWPTRWRYINVLNQKKKKKTRGDQNGEAILALQQKVGSGRGIIARVARLTFVGSSRGSGGGRAKYVFRHHGPSQSAARSRRVAREEARVASACRLPSTLMHHARHSSLDLRHART